MKKKQLLNRIAELEAQVADLQRQVEIANQYAAIMRGYHPPYRPIPQWSDWQVRPGDPGYMPYGGGRITA